MHLGKGDEPQEEPEGRGGHEAGRQRQLAPQSPASDSLQDQSQPGWLLYPGGALD